MDIDNDEEKHILLEEELFRWDSNETDLISWSGDHCLLDQVWLM
jgi:hypothetical protein